MTIVLPEIEKGTDPTVLIIHVADPDVGIIINTGTKVMVIAMIGTDTIQHSTGANLPLE